SPGGREVPVITGMRPKPGLHRRMGVGAIVVQDQMDGQSTGCAALDSPKETQKLLMAMARHAVPQPLSAQHLQCRKQRGGSVAGVIVSLPFCDSWTQGRIGWARSKE